MKKTILRIFSMVMIVVILSAFTVTSFATEIRQTRYFGDESNYTTFEIWVCGVKYDNSAYYWWGGAGASLYDEFPDDEYDPVDHWFTALYVDTDMYAFNEIQYYKYSFSDLIYYGDSTFNTEEFDESLHIYEILTSTTAYTYNSDLVFVEDAALNID